MESTTARKKWITLLLTATMGVALLFGATACNSNSNGGNSNGIVEGNESPTVAPDVDADADADADTESESPSASASAQ